MHRTRRPRGEHGAAAVEFALIMVPLLALVFGIMQYGFYFWSMQGGADTARYAARLASVGTPAGCTAFRTQTAAALGPVSAVDSAVRVARTYPGAVGAVKIGDTVVVTVQFRSYDLNLPFVPFIDDGVVTSTATSRVDYTPAPSYAVCPLAAP